MDNTEFLAKQNLYIQPYLLQNRADLKPGNLQEICNDSIKQLENSLQKCENLIFENKQTKRILTQQIKNEINNLNNAAQKQDVETLKLILQEELADAKDVAQNKAVSEMLIKHVKNQTPIINDLLEQKKQIDQIQIYTINYVKAQLGMFTYTEEEQQELKKLLASCNRGFKKILDGYEQYVKQEKAESTAAAGV